MCWVIMSPRRKRDIVNVLFTKTSANDSEKLCDADVLGLKESHYKHNNYLNEKFKKQLKRDEKCLYETGLG